MQTFVQAIVTHYYIIKYAEWLFRYFHWGEIRSELVLRFCVFDCKGILLILRHIIPSIAATKNGKDISDIISAKS